MAGLLACGIIPFWFAGSLLRVVFSESPRGMLKKRWPVLLIFGAATVFILYAFDLFPPRHEIPYPYSTPGAPTIADAIASADAIVEGSFQLNHVVSSSRDVFARSYYPNLKVNVFVIPFQIDRAVRGPASGAINVKLFFTLWPNTPFYPALPLREKMLLLLMRDTSDPNDYILASQNTAWLVLAQPHAADAMSADPAKFVLDDAKGFLAECLEHPGASGAIGYVRPPTGLSASLTVLSGSLGVINYPDNDPARAQALRIGKELGLSDPEFLAIAKKYEAAPQELGSTARSIRADSGDYSDLQARLTNAPSSPPAANGFHLIGDPRDSLPQELADAIRDSKQPAQLLPLVNQALASPDSRTREIVMQALYWYAGANGYGMHANRLGTTYFPIAVRMLDDRDQQVQYSALGCLFCMSGEVRKRVPDREFELPATMIFRATPKLYLDQAKAWWRSHHAALMTNAAQNSATEPPP